MGVSGESIRSINRLEIEKKWVENAKANPENFEFFYKQYHRQIYRYIYEKLNDRDQARDITSQVFYKAMIYLQKYEFKGVPFVSWLYRIAKSELYQSFREKKSLNIIDRALFQIPENINDDDSENEEKEYIKKKLFQCLKLLRRNDLVLIELRFFENQSFREIGNSIGITENNAKVRTFRAVERLRRLLVA